MITAAVTFVFAIPANTDHWRMESGNAAGGAWTFDRNGNIGWKAELILMPEKRVIAVAFERNVL
jgi:hypothetical protein